MSDTTATTKSLYLVPWIEVEMGWGSRPEGYRVFLDLETCKRETKRASQEGPYKGGYFGPERPLHYYEVPYDESMTTENFVDRLPKFRSPSNPIE